MNWFKQTKGHLRREEGQVLVQTTMMLMGLLAFIAIAIDAGNIYAERRRMQNAADAAALAGAYELCRLSSVDMARGKARDYLTRNGVQVIGPLDVVVDDNVVRVTARKTADAFLADLAGFPTFDVSAGASAACGVAKSACGIWPVTFELAFWEENLACGEKFILWDADKDNQQLTCTIDGEERPPCDCYNCDLDNDGEDDFRIITETSRGWLDFSDNIQPPYLDTCKAPGCGASELACRIRNDFSGKIEVPTCIPGLRGVKAGAKDDVESRIGDAVTIPLYSSTNCPSGSNCNGTDADTYYITKLGCVTVEGWEQNFELQPKPDFPDLKKEKSKAIIVSRRCDGACTSTCGTTDGEPGEPWEPTAASLIPHKKFTGMGDTERLMH
jgi:hypothetical protein